MRKAVPGRRKLCPVISCAWHVDACLSVCYLHRCAGALCFQAKKRTPRGQKQVLGRASPPTGFQICLRPAAGSRFGTHKSQEANILACTAISSTPTRSPARAKCSVGSAAVLQRQKTQHVFLFVVASFSTSEKEELDLLSSFLVSFLACCLSLPSFSFPCVAYLALSLHSCLVLLCSASPLLSSWARCRHCSPHFASLLILSSSLGTSSRRGGLVAAQAFQGRWHDCTVPMHCR